MIWGKHIVEESWRDGVPVKKTEWIEEQIAIANNNQLLNETLSALDIVVTEVSDSVIITIKRNKAGKLLLVKKHKVG